MKNKSLLIGALVMALAFGAVTQAGQDDYDAPSKSPYTFVTGFIAGQVVMGIAAITTIMLEMNHLKRIINESNPNVLALKIGDIRKDSKKITVFLEELNNNGLSAQQIIDNPEEYIATIINVDTTGDQQRITINFDGYDRLRRAILNTEARTRQSWGQWFRSFWQ